MTCRKCKKELPEGAAFCCWCGIRQQEPKKPKRANGEGCIIPHGNGYMAIVRKRGANGKYISKSKCGFKTQREARAYIPELQKAISRPGSLSENVTFAQLYDRWVPFYTPRVSEGEMKSAAAAFKWFSAVHNYTFTAITAQTLQDCIDACPRGKRTKENMKLLARRLYAYAKGENLSPVDYTGALYAGNDKKGKRPPFTLEEIAVIDRAEREGVPYADYVLAMIYTGFRPTEFLTLTAASFDPATNALTAGIKTEAGMDRQIPVHPRIQAIVGRALARGGVLFPDENGNMMDDERFRVRYFQPLMDTLGIRDRVPYSSRHSFANFLKRPEGERLPDKDIIALMGHSDKAQTTYYQTASIKELRAIVEAFPVLGGC
ncbi:MAG: tyrosine-type recombinase/integrase [Clostridia bacterium]|nr:tyrosine-type recombinase/integrase [Clostridia bacterium]